MGMEASTRKKKGRPSLNHNHSKPAPHSTPIYTSATTTRRSTRRNPNPEEEEEEESSLKQRRDKELKLVVQLPSSSSPKRRKITPIGDGSDSAKGHTPLSAANPTSNHQGAKMDLGPSAPLPDKTLLLSILDRLQKKDTYSVFSEPVDPKELPDYHEIIEHPMDFSTVKKKLAGGAYDTLQHFEEDISLICLNAMQYNSPNTIYFRQARSIQELAIKNFENLRQDGDYNEPERKVVRRGRPPTKHLKKPLGRPPNMERTGSEISDATLATGGVNNISANYDTRKGAHLDKSSFVHKCHNTDPNWLAQNKFDNNDDLSGSVMKGNSMKLGKKQFVSDENRRHTYKQFHPSAGGREPSVLATFSVERKQLMAVGLHSEQGYARSLALFAASLGPVAWKIASKRIERSLSIGVNFGPGWVGENDILPQRQLFSPVPLSNPLSSSQSLHVAGDSVPVIVRLHVDRKEDELPEKRGVYDLPGNEVLLSPPPTVPTSSSIFVTKKCSEPITIKLDNAGPKSIRPISSLPVQEDHLICPSMNGVKGAYGFNLPAQRPLGIRDHSSQVRDTSDKNFVHQPTVNNVLKSEERDKHVEIRSESQLPTSESELSRSERRDVKPSRDGSLLPQQKPKSWPSQQQKQDLVQPDMNIRFQSPRSPSSSRVDTIQPDLALQL